MYIKYLLAAICAHIFDKWTSGQGWGGGVRQESPRDLILLSGNFWNVYLGGEAGGRAGGGPSSVYLFDPCQGEPSHFFLQSYA